MLETLMEGVGWAGALAFAFSAMPQVYMCWRQKHARGLSFGLIGLFILGSGLMLAYVAYKHVTRDGQWPLVFNYGLTFASWLVILYFKLTGEEKKHA